MQKKANDLNESFDLNKQNTASKSNFTDRDLLSGSAPFSI